MPGLSDFIRVPNLSPLFDPDYQDNGLNEQAMACVDDWINKLEIEHLQKEIFHPEGANPLIVYKYDPPEGADQMKTLLFYGHLDK